MLDIQKPIQGLSADWERVYADLTEPETVREAVITTGATRAFLYHTLGTDDSHHMRATIQSLKDAGIELVVFLSTFTVLTRANLEDFKPDEPIQYVHAQNEMALRDVFGKDNVVVVREGLFASVVQIKEELERGVVRVLKPEQKVDNIVPEDVGRVCGTILANGPQDEERVILLYGPKLWSTVEIVKTIAKKVGKDPEIKFVEEEEVYQDLVEKCKVLGLPEPENLAAHARHIVKQVVVSGPGENHMWGIPITEEQLHNVEKYSGKKPTTFEEWVEQNKQLFVS